MKTAKRVAIIITGIVVALCLAALAWANSSLRATDHAPSYLQGENRTVFTPTGKGEFDEYEYGFVFYPGAKVEPAAYAPLLQKCADEGWPCVTTDAAFHLALLNQDAAADVIANHPNVKHWYVGGHSMGGVAAAYYTERNIDQVSGLVLLASYPTSEMSTNNLDVVFVRGTNDTVLTLDKYSKWRNIYGENARELVIQGGNHAQFGDYGNQEKDSSATINCEEQQNLTADFITQGRQTA